MTTTTVKINVSLTVEHDDRIPPDLLRDVLGSLALDITDLLTEDKIDEYVMIVSDTAPKYAEPAARLKPLLLECEYVEGESSSKV